MPSAPFMLARSTGRHIAIQLLRSIAVAGTVCAAAIAVHAAPADIEAVQGLLAQGKVNDAAKAVQTQLKHNPGDVQLRFLQGVIAAEQQKYDQAIHTFTSLTQDHPYLPEPYNNLAVLYAAKGDERKAAQVLEQAIRTNPSYATAHENLGDLYARMASDAYAKALQLDSNRQPAKPKLSLITHIYPMGAPATAPRTAAPVVATATALQPVPAAATPAAAPAATESAAPPETAEPSFTPPQPAVGAPVVETKTARAPAAQAQPAQAATPAAEKKPDTHTHQKAAVEKAVYAWAKAWSQQNMNAYYAAYSDKFQPSSGSLSAWKAERKDRIVGKPEITLEVQDLKITVQGERAAASFRQYYASGGYRATTRKVLRMQHEGGEKWRIVREETGR